MSALDLASTLTAALERSGWRRSPRGWVSPRPIMSTLSSRAGERRDEPVSLVQATSAQLRHEAGAKP